MNNRNTHKSTNNNNIEKKGKKTHNVLLQAKLCDVTFRLLLLSNNK